MGKTQTSSEGEELSAGEGQAYKRTPEKAGPAASETVPTAMCQAQLLLRSSSGTEEMMRACTNGGGAGGDSAGLSGSSRTSAGSMEQ